jgi:MSHA biogenesis protein MshJ
VKTAWLKTAARIDALSLRERVAVFGTLITVICFVAVTLFLEPALARKKVLDAGMAQQRAEMQAIQAQIATMDARRGGTDAANLARRDSVKVQIAEIDLSLKDMNQNLVPAQNMKVLLQEMLTHQPRVQLLALRTLPATPLVEKSTKPAEKSDASGALAPPAAKSAAGDGNVFKHGVEITLQGSYADLYEYLTRVEKLHWRMFWSRASLNAEDYPRLKLTVTIYTLSLDKAWLVV